MEGSFKRFCKGWFESIVVVFSAMVCFRTYFFDWKCVPTGSMQPTIWGNHTVAVAEKGAWDVFPLSTLKWLWTGEKFEEFKAPVSGTVRVSKTLNDGFADVSVGTDGTVFRLPDEAALGVNGLPVRAGDTVWRGSVVSGEYVLENMIAWNFRQPRDGDIMVFSTTGLGPNANGECLGADGMRYDVPQGIHYIKRMKATPGETYVLEHPVSNRPDVVTMGEGQYFACGDNFRHSLDSRYWGGVPRDNLGGTGCAVVWPVSRWRALR